MKLLFAFALLCVLQRTVEGSTVKSSTAEIPTENTTPAPLKFKRPTPEEILNTESYEKAVKLAMGGIEDMNSLEFSHEECNITEELERQAIEKRFLGELMLQYIVPPESHGPINQRLKQTLAEMMKFKGPFCNTFEHLECTPDLKAKGQTSCQCSKHVEKFLNFRARFYRAKEEKACVIAKGEMCAPPEVVSFVNHQLLFGAYPNTKLTCAEGTPCLIKSNGKRCDLFGLLEELDRIGQLHNSTKTDTEFKLAMAAQGICVCKGTTLQLPTLWLMFVSLIVTIYFVKLC